MKGGIAMGKEEQKKLLNVKDLCSCLNIGKTKARELLHDPSNGFTVRIGSRLYAHRDKLEKWLSQNEFR